jgi:hypothetical protein
MPCRPALTSPWMSPCNHSRRTTPWPMRPLPLCTALGAFRSVWAPRAAFTSVQKWLVFRSWSGSEVFVSSETSLAGGLGIGGEIPVGRALGIVAEAFARFSGAEELSTALVGLGLSVVPVGARQRAH